jgi:hypothetical protein
VVEKGCFVRCNTVAKVARKGSPEAPRKVEIDAANTSYGEECEQWNYKSLRLRRNVCAVAMLVAMFAAGQREAVQTRKRARCRAAHVRHLGKRDYTYGRMPSHPFTPIVSYKKAMYPPH